MIIVNTRMSTFFTAMSLPLIIFHQAISMEFQRFHGKSILCSTSQYQKLNKNFESFAELSKSVSFKFTIICFSETWSNDESLSKNTLFELEVYSLLHQNLAEVGE